MNVFPLIRHKPLHYRSGVRFISSILFFIFLLCTSAFAQTTKTITGKVTDESSKPLSGVSVTIKNTTRGTVTNNSGNFSLSAADGDVLVISYIGYTDNEIAVGNATDYPIALKATSQSLDQVVVVGYGTQRKSTTTGAISSVDAKTINALPVASVQQALQGRVAGLTVTNNGAPGTEPLVKIRGISSINFASDPLYVVDGFPTGSISSFDSKDIQSVEVLKDASAAAIYGSRATNGVIIITTKKGTRDGRLHVNLDSYVGTQTAWRTIDLLNTQQYLQYERALNGAANISLPPRLQPENFNQPIYDGTNQTYAQTNTDWQDAYFKNGIITQHNLSVSGGNEVSRFYASGGYFKQDGIAQGVNFERGNFRINSEHNISKIFSFGENVYASFSKQRFDNTGGNRTRLVNVIRGLPYLPVYDPTTLGGFRNAENSVDGADPTNPVEDAIMLGNATRQTLKLFGTVYGQVNFTPWLNFRSTFGIDYTNQFQHQFTPIYNDKGRNSSVAVINDQTRRSTVPLFTEQITFDKTFGEHHVNAIAVYEQQEYKDYGEVATGNQATNDIETLIGATNTSITSSRSEAFLLSYIGRVNYEYAGKYLLSAAIRRDGLSVWAPGRKYANFPSASIGWRIDQEDFMKNSKAISQLKVRAGYGVTGLNGVSIFSSTAPSILANQYPYQAVVVAGGATYPFNNTNPAGNASYNSTIANPDLEWEKTKQLNIGLDLGLLQNKITLVAEYYNRKTDNLILVVPTPSSAGYNGAGVYQNVASMRNKGFDFQLGYNKTQGKFTWNITGILSTLKNDVVTLNTPTAVIDQGGDQDFGGGTAITRTTAGQPIQSYYGYIVDGIFQTADEVAKSAYQTDNTAPGDLKFRDLNNDNKITDADRTFLGNYFPDFTYSLNYSASYKNFDLSIFFQGVQGNEIFNAGRIITEGMARLFGAGTNVLKAWTPENTNTNIPRAISGDPNQNVRPSTRWIEDGSYLRLKNVALGYTFNNSSLQWTGGAVKSIRLYVSGFNLLTFTKYKGWDPEIGSKNTTLTNGIDYGQYPSARSFQVGIQAGF